MAVLRREKCFTSSARATWVVPGAFVIFVTFRTQENWWHRHKQYPDTTFTRFYSVPPSTTLTCCWPPGRSSSATAASTFATKAPPVGSKLSPSSALLFLSWPSTSDDPISIKLRRQSWIGLVQGKRGPDAANSIPQRPPKPTTLPSYCTQNKHHVPICHIPVDHFGLFIFQDVKTLLWKDYSYNLLFHQSENAHILKESKLNSSDFLYICGLWRGLNRRKRFPFNWFDLSPPIHFHPFSKSTLQQYLWFKRFSKELYFLSMSWLLFFSQMSGKRFSNQKWTEGLLVSHVLYFLSFLGRFVLLLQKKFGSQNSKRVTFQLILWPYFDKILNMVVGVKKQMVDILPRVCHTNILKFFPQYN